MFGEKRGKNARVVQFPFLAVEPLPFTGRGQYSSFRNIHFL